MRKGVQESKKEDDGDSVALMRYMSDNFEDLFLNVSTNSHSWPHEFNPFFRTRNWARKHRQFG